MSHKVDENSVAKYDFNIMEVLKTSYKMSKGFKGTFLGMSIMSGIIILAILFPIIYFIFPNFTIELIETQEFMDKFEYIKILLLPIFTIFSAGIQMVVLRYTRGEEVSIKNMFDYFNLILKLTLLAFSIFAIQFVVEYILDLAFVSENHAIAIVKSIIISFVNILFIFSYILLIDKNIGVVDAMKLSFVAVKQNLWKIAILYFLFIFSAFAYNYINLLSPIFSLIFLIAMIWIIPTMFILFYGLLYRIIFDGVELQSK